MDKRYSYTSKIKGEVMQRYVFGELLTFIKTSDGRLIIQKVKQAPFKPNPKYTPIADIEARDNKMIQLRQEGHSLQYIGMVLGVTSGRVSQITKHLGVSPVRNI